VDLNVGEGMFVLVTGPNGAGKSTLLRLLYRTYRPTAGEAWYASRHGRIDLARAADADIVRLRRDEIGFVTQFLRPRPRASALDLVAEPALSAGVSAAAAYDEAERSLAAFGLKRALWHAYPATFSGGEQQRVNLARALSSRYRLLLLDEPNASLDPDARAALRDRLAALKRAGTTVIAVLHDAADAATVVDRTVAIAVPAQPSDGQHVQTKEEAHVAE
jgi:alpha-D-ribose 1-methylphosphonate 5-triphosphate synthase subunit PhnL